MLRFIEQSTGRLLEFFGACFFAFLGYISPLKDILYLTILFFVVDIIYGWRADRKLNNAKFQPGIIWAKTIPRMVLSLTALILAFLIDKVTGQKWINTYLIIGWIICGLLFVSIMKNGYIITEWRVIKYAVNTLKYKVSSVTGVEIKDEDSK